MIWPLFGCVISVVINFSIYYVSLAPTVTLEDSGELIAAAYSLGVPHPPGYPIFTVFGWLFSQLPIGTIAFRLNMMSAFFSALAAGFIYLSCYRLAQIVLNKSATKIWVHIVSISVSIFVSMCPTYFRQSVITEVYGVNNFLAAILIYFILSWYYFHLQKDDKRRERNFYLYCFFCGLGLANHHTMWMYVPLGLVFAWTVNKKYLWHKRLPLGIGASVLGLFPYAYLPWSASRNPMFNWSDPDNWTSFLQHISRYQYRRPFWRSADVFLEELRQQIILLLEQFPAPLIVLGCLGLMLLTKLKAPHGKRLFIWATLFLFLTGPVTAALTHFEIPFNSEFHFKHITAMVSVFYLPHYMIWGLLIAMGCFGILFELNKKKTWNRLVIPLACLLLISSFWQAHTTWKKEDKSQYYFADKLFKNWQTLAKNKKALFISNWDILGFPQIYLQHVEKRFPEAVFIDLLLLKQPWYLKTIRRWYPEFTELIDRPLSFHESLVGASVRGEEVDPYGVYDKYLGLINKMISLSIENDIPVYLIIFRGHRGLPPGIAMNDFEIHSQFVAGRVVKKGAPTENLKFEDFDFSGFDHPTVKHDRLAEILSVYYGGFVLDRAIELREEDPEEAIKLFDKGFELVKSDSALSRSYNEQYLKFQEKRASGKDTKSED